MNQILKYLIKFFKTFSADLTHIKGCYKSLNHDDCNNARKIFNQKASKFRKLSFSA